jgi:uncharacterized protein YbaP (TraB family)
MGTKARRRLIALLAWLVAASTPWTGALGEPAAWRIAGENGGEVALLGSMHVLRAVDYPLPPSVDALFERAEILVMELDLDDVDAAAQQSTILGAAMLPAGTVLGDVLDGSVYRLAQRRSAELGVDLTLLERFEPWFLAITILDQGMRKLGFAPERGLEQYLVGKSRSAGKEILGLETLALQIGIFDALPAQAQQAMLEQTLQELDEAETAMVDLAVAWRNGQLETLSEELLDDFENFPGLYDALVTQRNGAWVEALEGLLTDGRRYLVVVGALHLVGRDNVIDLLAARGHDAVRLD